MKARLRQLERAVAEKQKEVVKGEQEKAELQQTNIGLKKQVKDLVQELQHKDTLRYVYQVVYETVNNTVCLGYYVYILHTCTVI